MAIKMRMPVRVTGVTLDKSSINLTTVGQTEQLTATISPANAEDTAVTWGSSDTNVVTVSSTGLVTCVTPGEATITVTTHDGGYTATCGVTDQGGWQPGVNTIAYFPFAEDFADHVGSRALTVSGCAISGGYAEVSNASSYMTLSSTIGGSNITINCWYYYGGTAPYNTLFCYYGGGKHHVLIPSSGYGPAGQIGFYNDAISPGGFWGDIVMTTGNWYNVVIVKNGTNEKIYVNAVSAIDSNNGFDNNSYPVGIIANYTASGNQGSIGKLSEVIFEDRVWTEQEITDYFNQTKGDYGIS